MCSVNIILFLLQQLLLESGTSPAPVHLQNINYINVWRWRLERDTWSTYCKSVLLISSLQCLYSFISLYSSYLPTVTFHKSFYKNSFCKSVLIHMNCIVLCWIWMKKMSHFTFKNSPWDLLTCTELAGLQTLAVYLTTES